MPRVILPLEVTSGLDSEAEPFVDADSASSRMAILEEEADAVATAAMASSSGVHKEDDNLPEDLVEGLLAAF